MHSLTKHIAFVKDQIRHYDGMARKSNKDELRAEKYIQLAASTRDLLTFLESLNSQPQILSGEGTPQVPVQTTAQHAEVLAKLPPNFFATFGVSSIDIEGAPEELKAELKNISEADKLEALIVDLINAGGGTIGTDKLIMGLYHLTGEVQQRVPLVAKLYRMSKKGLIYSVPKKKGAYTTIKPEGDDEVPEPEQEQLDLQDQ